MKPRLAGWAASSANPEEVSNRVKGIIISLSAVIIFFAANFFQVVLTPQDIFDLATMLAGLAGLGVSIYGAGLAFVRWIAQKRPV